MDLRHLHTDRALNLIPAWIGLDRRDLIYSLDLLFHDYLKDKKINYFKRVVPFWVECDVANNRIEIKEPDGSVDNHGWFVFYNLKSPMGGSCQVEIPLNDLFIKVRNGNHVLYLHGFDTQTPLYYVGITKKPWYERMSQHISSANRGSPYVFHDAIRKHKDVKKVHKIILGGLNYDQAMYHEEQWSMDFTLYPMGLNMIPGGHAGLGYLRKFDIKPQSLRERDAAIERLASHSSIKGRPNPLCAARWSADQDFINRVICGCAGRLTVEQVNSIRRFSGFGKAPEEISDILSIVNVRQVRDVITGKYYNRVK